MQKEKRRLKREITSAKDEEKFEELKEIKKQMLQEEEVSYYRKLKKTCE